MRASTAFSTGSIAVKPVEKLIFVSNDNDKYLFFKIFVVCSFEVIIEAPPFFACHSNREISKKPAPGRGISWGSILHRANPSSPPFLDANSVPHFQSRFNDWGRKSRKTKGWADAGKTRFLSTKKKRFHMDNKKKVV